MHTYTIEEARRIVMNCAKQYDKNLKDRQYIILYKDRQTNEIQYIEVQFKDINYQHLTGVEMTDKLIGNVNFCLGLKGIADHSFVPASALLEDIKKLTSNQSQVIAIFSKNIFDTFYEEIRYVAKGINLNKITLSTNISEKICLKNYIPK